MRRSARDLIELVIDRGTWVSWDEAVADPAPLDADYAAALAAARRTTGVDEAVITGAGRLGGRQVAVIAGEFAFLGGSIGVAAAERLTRAVERATAERIPLLAAPASGGTRMQEGSIAFLQMVKISQAITAHKAAGLPYLVYLRHPTTGGVYASWGSLGHLTVAEPGALIGFLGPKVYEALTGSPFPAGVQVAENLHKHGLIDAVVAPEQVAPLADRALATLSAPRRLPRPPSPVEDPPGERTAWEAVRRSRRADRPGIRRLLRHAGRDVVPLHGTQSGETGAGVIVALARFGEAPAVVVGHDRRDSPPDPAGLRAVRRGFKLAAELGLPVVTVVDTPGAALSPQAEEGGLAGEIAQCLADLVTLPVPTLCVLLGQGSGGAALALLPADRVIAAAHGWLSPLPPEGASAILHRTVERAPQVSAAQGIRAQDLRARGIVDRIVAERPDAADEPAAFLDRLGAVLAHELATLLDVDPADRLQTRRVRYRQL
ncbi:carboxyl transferase domain-containing protein [Micromonospora purpureochromogenes]|uniref:Acetyl-CoA carboxylase carboxyl transferase subunit beta n=1 Tax=Micromonospora purpureochromogenes TaxID=47872 RepID=A0ABX2RTV4_9ACTN|nr:carboxyl transferase domain-containing protein [Micromonospora purpureochromogenes]NYF59972.1 acetyl-CoA carboxylase carboxyl transferase subunit beta [Micromonospora purpureochromogenes]